MYIDLLFIICFLINRFLNRHYFSKSEPSRLVFPYREVDKTMQVVYMLPYVLLIYSVHSVKFIILISIHIFILGLNYAMCGAVLSILIENSERCK